MTTPVVEDDVVERLRAEKIDVPIPGLPFCTERITRPVCEEAAALIEQQRKTIEDFKAALLDHVRAENECSMMINGLPCADTSWDSNVCGCSMEARALLQGDKKE